MKMIQISNIFKLFIVGLLTTILGCSAEKFSDSENGNEKENKPAENFDAGEQKTQYKYPLPRDYITTKLGSEQSLDIGAWNLKWFPLIGDTTTSLVADYLFSMDLDLIYFEEISNTDAFKELAERMRGYDYIYSSDEYFDGSYQKIALLYKSSVLELRESKELFKSEAYAFPRSVLSAEFQYRDSQNNAFYFIALGVHLKAGVKTKDTERRTAALEKLHTYMRESVTVGKEKLILLGDFNANLTGQWGQVSFLPFTEDSEHFEIMSQEFAENNGTTFLSYSKGSLDHMVITKPFAEAFKQHSYTVPQLHQESSSFKKEVSDHLPIIGLFKTLKK